MAEAKTELFDSHDQHLAQLYKALAHPARISILRFLAQGKTCYTGNISDELPLGRTTINQHLAELKKANLIHGQVSGAKTNYCINTKMLELLQSHSQTLFTDLSSTCRDDNCGKT